MTPNATSQPKRRDWAALDRQHQRRGTLAFTLLLNPDVLKPPVRKVGRGRPQRYTDTFVEALLTMRVALRLPYRVLEGAARAIFQSHGLDPSRSPTTPFCASVSPSWRLGFQPFGPASTPVCLSTPPVSR